MKRNKEERERERERGGESEKLWRVTDDKERNSQETETRRGDRSRCQ